MSNNENQTGAVTIFMRQTALKFEALSKDNARALYEKKNESISLIAETWSFADEALQDEFNRNPEIVSQLLEKLETAKENEVDAILLQLRKYHRKGVIVHGFFQKAKVDEKTGELVMSANGLPEMIPHVRFFDPYTGKPFTMGQAVIGGFFSGIETDFQNQGETVIGIAFDITYFGLKKNKGNAYKSDRFEIKISEYQPLQNVEN